MFVKDNPLNWAYTPKAIWQSMAWDFAYIQGCANSYIYGHGSVASIPPQILFLVRKHTAILICFSFCVYAVFLWVVKKPPETTGNKRLTRNERDMLKIEKKNND